MTRRERKEARLARRLDWAQGRDAKAAAGFKKAETLASGIPLGQPILLGHHSEKRHRADLARIDGGMRQGVESQDMAAKHRSVAAGIERQLDVSIFSDDADAVAALEARIAEREAQRERMKAENKAFRRGPGAYAGFLGITSEEEAQRRAEIMARYSWQRQPFAAYELANLGGRITTDRQRLASIKAQAQRSAQAEAAPGGCLVQYFPGARFVPYATPDAEGRHGHHVEDPRHYVTLTFAEKPDRAVLGALRAAGFLWGAGRWSGKTENLPPGIVPAEAQP